MNSQIVNRIWKGDFKSQLVLGSLVFKYDKIVSVRYQSHSPEQLIIKFNDGVTMLIFKSGKFRFCGLVVEYTATLHKNSIFLEISVARGLVYLPPIEIQAITAVCNFNRKIHLNKCDGFLCEELFPAIHINKFKPIHINVFASGKAVICGCKSDAQVDVIARDLFDLVKPGFM